MKHLLKIIFILFSFFVPTSCFVLNKYILTDKELAEHYKNKPVKPAYKYVRFLGRNIHYAVISKNDTLPLLVFVHGAPGAWYGTLKFMDDSVLQQHFKMISVDRPGYGKSDYGKAELSTQLQALSIKEVIDKENTSGKKIVLFGRSYGAAISAWLAINYPQNVSKLFMISPVINPDKEKFYWFSPIGKWKIVQWMLPKMLNVATSEKYSHSNEMRIMLPKWKKLYVPTTIVSGGRDWIADTSNFTFARKQIINCDTTLIYLKESGHLVTYENPTLIKQLLLKND